MTRVIVVGSANVDLVWRGARLPAPGETVTDGEFLQVFGGKGANQACAAAALGAEVLFVGCVGDDELGAAVRDDLESHGVDCTWLTVARGIATGVALISVDARGENAIAVAPGANRELTPGHVEQAIAAVAIPDAAPVTVVTGLEIGVANAHSALRAAANRHCFTVFNPSPVDVDARCDFGYCDTVIVNEVEVAQYQGVDALRSASAGSVVVTSGARGVDWYGESVQHCDAFSVDVVDTTGAGDAFCAAFAVERDLAFAAATAALACRAVGARGSQPNRREVGALLREQPRSPR
jgi:ribokinase